MISQWYNSTVSCSNKKIELLAPAGNMTALNAAVRAGADAVYLGLEHFNARRGAANFTIASLKEACDYAHLRGVKIYLTLNIIIFEEEFEKAIKLSFDAAKAGIDAFIVQDLGLAKTIAEKLPQIGLHISTQMNIHDEAGLRAVATLGAKRVTLARELSIEKITETAKIAKKLNLEIETFAHGALCVCYSGQCLMSSMIGGRSANRGTCAQPCRLNYELKTGEWKLGKRRNNEDDKRGSYLLSPKDLCTIEILSNLIDANVDSLKIEGRMKSPEYVYSVVSVYRKAIDRYYKNPDDYFVNDDELKQLNEAFSRGFSTAYMQNKRGNEIMSYKRPNNRGLNVGRVSFVSKNKIVIDTKQNLNLGDVLEIWTKRGRSTFRLDKNSKILTNSVELRPDKNDNTIKNISKSDRVFRVKSVDNEFVYNEFLPKIIVDCFVELRIGKKAKICVSACGKSVEHYGQIVESARTKEVLKDDVAKHIDRLGQTPFKIGNLEIILDDNVGIGFSQIHHLRAEALKKLEVEILKTKEKVLNIKCNSFYKNKDNKSNQEKNSNDIKICVLTTNPSSARAAKRAGADIIYVPYLNYKKGWASIAGKACNVEESCTYPKDIVIVQPTIDAKLDKKHKKLMCDNFGSVVDALNNGLDVEAGPHLPIVNITSAQLLENIGVKRIWLSPEISINQIKCLTGASSKISFGYYVYGATELMITKHCHLMNLGQCNQDCKNCHRRQNQHYLLDRKAYEFPVVTDVSGNSHIYNSVSIDLRHAFKELLEVGIDSFMIDASLLDSEQTAQAVGSARKSIVKNLEKSKNTTTGHAFRPLL